MILRDLLKLGSTCGVPTLYVHSAYLQLRFEPSVALPGEIEMLSVQHPISAIRAAARRTAVETA